MTKTFALVALLAVATGLAATAYFALRAPEGDRYAGCREPGVTVGLPRDFSTLGFVSETGEAVQFSAYLDEPSVIYFGYTFCPDVCPFDAARNADAVDIVAEEGIKFRPIFVTVDPERDTPEVVGEFADLLHDDMVGLTGSEDQIREATRTFGVYAARGVTLEDNPDFYLMDHSVLSYVMAPGGENIATLAGSTVGVGTPAEMSAERMARILTCFAKNF